MLKSFSIIWKSCLLYYFKKANAFKQCSILNLCSQVCIMGICIPSFSFKAICSISNLLLAWFSVSASFVPTPQSLFEIRQCVGEWRTPAVTSRLHCHAIQPYRTTVLHFSHANYCIKFHAFNCSIEVLLHHFLTA